jgi:SAM-dependent methyltransferase
VTLSKKTFVYTGCEVLEAIAEAENYNRYLVKMIQKQVARSPKKKPVVLDFGAGMGLYADMLKDDTKSTIDCLEPDKKLQKMLTKKGYKVLASADDLKPNSYDVIYSLNVMEHIEDDHKVFGQLTKALKKNGIIVIYVPAFQSLYSSMDKLVEHHRRYRKSHLRKMANDNDLKIVTLQYCDPIGFGAALAFKAVGNKSGVISPRSVKIYDRVAFPVSRIVEPASKHIVGKNVVLVAEK